MTAPKGTWKLLSWVVARDDQTDAQAETAFRKILLNVVDGKERIRYLNIDELPPRTEAAGYILSAPDADKGRRADYRYDPLPPSFLRHGRINWRFSMLTLFDDLAVHHIELFFPSIARNADAAPLSEPKRGRPSKKDEIKEEAERLLQGSHHYATRAELARVIMRRVAGRTEKTICAYLLKLELPPRKVPKIISDKNQL